MNQEEQKADKIISNITEGLEKDVIHNPYEKRLPYESIKWGKRWMGGENVETSSVTTKCSTTTNR